MKKKVKPKKIPVGRPKKDPVDVKKKRTIRVSDQDMELIETTGLSLQGLVDQAIGSLRPLDPEALREDLEAFSRTVKRHFTEGL